MTNEQIAAEFAARNLISRYALLLDDRKVPEVAALFAQDAVLTVAGQTYEGREAVAGWVQSLTANPPGKHMASSTLVEHDGGVRSTTDFVFMVPAEGVWKGVVGGRYLDTFGQVDGTWQFTRREVVLDMRGR